MMRGMYIDDNACMVLVVASGERGDLTDYCVYGAEVEGTQETNDGWSAKCTLNAPDSKVELIHKGQENTTRDSAFHDKDGHFNEQGEIVWDSGETWRPVHMSSIQFQFFTRRPYVPMTYVLAMMTQSLLFRAKALLLDKMATFHKHSS